MNCPKTNQPHRWKRHRQPYCLDCAVDQCEFPGCEQDGKVWRNGIALCIDHDSDGES